jgi:DNA-binding transcriptional LysR family regulator
VVYALKKGYGIAAISRFVIAAELRAGSLSVIAVRGWNVHSLISVLRVRDVLLTPAAEEFQTLVRRRFGEISREPTCTEGS